MIVFESNVIGKKEFELIWASVIKRFDFDISQFWKVFLASVADFCCPFTVIVDVTDSQNFHTRASFQGCQDGLDKKI